MAFIEKIRVRYNECDMQGVVFNANYWMYVDDAVAQWIRHAFAALQKTEGDLPDLASLGFDFMLKTATGTWHKGAKYGDEIEAQCSISRWGTTSFDVAVSLTVKNSAVFDCSITYVSVTPGTHTPCPVPEQVKSALDSRR